MMGSEEPKTDRNIDPSVCSLDSFDPIPCVQLKMKELQKKMKELKKQAKDLGLLIKVYSIKDESGKGDPVKTFGIAIRYNCQKITVIKEDPFPKCKTKKEEDAIIQNLLANPTPEWTQCSHDIDLKYSQGQVTASVLVAGELFHMSPLSISDASVEVKLSKSSNEKSGENGIYIRSNYCLSADEKLCASKKQDSQKKIEGTLELSTTSNEDKAVGTVKIFTLGAFANVAVAPISEIASKKILKLLGPASLIGLQNGKFGFTRKKDKQTGKKGKLSPTISGSPKFPSIKDIKQWMVEHGPPKETKEQRVARLAGDPCEINSKLPRNLLNCIMKKLASSTKGTPLDIKNQEFADGSRLMSMSFGVSDIAAVSIKYSKKLNKPSSTMATIVVEEPTDHSSLFSLGPVHFYSAKIVASYTGDSEKKQKTSFLETFDNSNKKKEDPLKLQTDCKEAKGFCARIEGTFCLGQPEFCNMKEDDRDEDKTITGTLSLHYQKNYQHLVASDFAVTVGSFMYVGIAAATDDYNVKGKKVNKDGVKGAADSIVAYMQPLSQIGIKDVRFGLVRRNGKISPTLSGSPVFPADKECDAKFCTISEFSTLRCACNLVQKFLTGKATIQLTTLDEQINKLTSLKSSVKSSTKSLKSSLKGSTKLLELTASNTEVSKKDQRRKRLLIDDPSSGNKIDLTYGAGAYCANIHLAGRVFDIAGLFFVGSEKKQCFKQNKKCGVTLKARRGLKENCITTDKKTGLAMSIGTDFCMGTEDDCNFDLYGTDKNKIKKVLSRTLRGDMTLSMQKINSQLHLHLKASIKRVTIRTVVYPIMSRMFNGNSDKPDKFMKFIGDDVADMGLTDVTLELKRAPSKSTKKMQIRPNLKGTPDVVGKKKIPENACAWENLSASVNSAIDCVLLRLRKFKKNGGRIVIASSSDEEAASQGDEIKGFVQLEVFKGPEEKNVPLKDRTLPIFKLRWEQGGTVAGHVNVDGNFYNINEQLHLYDGHLRVKKYSKQSKSGKSMEIGVGSEFCMGTSKACDIAENPKSSKQQLKSVKAKIIQGGVTLSHSTGKNGGTSAVGRSPLITLGSFTAVALPHKVEKAVNDKLGDLKNIGIKDCVVSIEQTGKTAKTTAISITGTPSFKSKDGTSACKAKSEKDGAGFNPVLCALELKEKEDGGKMPHLILSSEIKPNRPATLKIAVAMKPMISDDATSIEKYPNNDKFVIIDHYGKGPSMYFEFDQGIKVGIEAGIRVAIEDELQCKKGTTLNTKPDDNSKTPVCMNGKTQASNKPFIHNKKVLFFEGKLEVGVGKLGGTLGGELMMYGTWNNILGKSWLHAADLKVGLTIMAAVPPLPTSMELGGEFCIGSKSACFVQKKTDSTFLELAGRALSTESTELIQLAGNNDGHFIKVLGHVKIDVVDPSKNFILVMFSKITLGKLLLVLGENLNKKFTVIGKYLPKQLLDSGLYARKKCSPEQQKDVAKHPECFARFSVAASQQTIVKSTGNIVVPQGIAASGKFNFLGWTIACDIEISPSRFYIDGVMDPLKFDVLNKNIITIYRCNPSKSQNKKKKCDSNGPKFLVDLNTAGGKGKKALAKGVSQGKVNVDIQGYMKIPMLGLEIETIVLVTKKLVKIDLDVPNLFGMFKGRFQLETAISKTKPKFYMKVAVQQRADAFEKIVKFVLGGVLQVLNAIEAVAKKFQELLVYMENICDKIFAGKDTLKDICNAGIGPDGAFRGIYMKFLSILDYIAQLVIKVKQKVAKALGIGSQSQGKINDKGDESLTKANIKSAMENPTGWPAVPQSGVSQSSKAAGKAMNKLFFIDELLLEFNLEASDFMLRAKAHFKLFGKEFKIDGKIQFNPTDVLKSLKKFIKEKVLENLPGWGAIQKYLKSVCPGGFSTDCISKIFTKAWNGLKKQLTVGAMLENGKKLFAGLKNLAGLDGRNKFTMSASGNGEHLWAFDGIGDMYYRNFRDTDCINGVDPEYCSSGAWVKVKTIASPSVAITSIDWLSVNEDGTRVYIIFGGFDIYKMSHGLKKLEKDYNSCIESGSDDPKMFVQFDNKDIGQGNPETVRSLDISGTGSVVCTVEVTGLGLGLQEKLFAAAGNKLWCRKTDKHAWKDMKKKGVQASMDAQGKAVYFLTRKNALFRTSFVHNDHTDQRWEKVHLPTSELQQKDANSQEGTFLEETETDGVMVLGTTNMQKRRSSEWINLFGAAEEKQKLQILIEETSSERTEALLKQKDEKSQQHEFMKFLMQKEKESKQDQSKEPKKLGLLSNALMLELSTQSKTKMEGFIGRWIDKACGNNNYKERCVCGGCHGGYKCSSASNGKMCVRHDKTLGPNALCGNDAECSFQYCRNNWGNMRYVGRCTTGKKDSKCYTRVSNGCQNGLTCRFVPGYVGGDVNKAYCGDGKAGSYCGKNDDCESKFCDVTTGLSNAHNKDTKRCLNPMFSLAKGKKCTLDEECSSDDCKGNSNGYTSKLNTGTCTGKFKYISVSANGKEILATNDGGSTYIGKLLFVCLYYSINT